AALDDPATGLVPSEARAQPAAAESPPAWSWTDGKILVVRITDYRDLERDSGGRRTKGEELKAQIGPYAGGLFGLQARTPETKSGIIRVFFQHFGNPLVARQLVGPSERSIVHSGYWPQVGRTSGGYFSGFRTREGTRFVPEPGAKARRVAFIVNARSELP